MSDYSGESRSESSAENSYTYAVYRVHRGKPGNGDGRYDGVYYRNCFKVSGGPIYLLAVKLYGPATAETASYEVSVSVDTPLWDYKVPSCYFFLPCFKGTVNNYGKATGITGEVKKGEQISVEFDEPIFIPESRWIEISFTIKSKARFASMDPNSLYDTARVNTEAGYRNFIFQMGSYQLPTIEFAVKNPMGTDSSNA